MTVSRDRRALLAASTTLNGIDFVEIADDTETVLRVHFLNNVTVMGTVTGATITGGSTIPVVEVLFDPAAWDVTGARPTLELRVEAPGDFSTYSLELATSSVVLDPYFARATFSFKARCPSDLDCEVPPPVCPPIAGDAPSIDYLAKDFDSFKRALSTFSAQHYPAWQERSEADFGVMFMEALSSVADDLSYLQDRVAQEAWIETATERRSLVRLARLVDYEPRVATCARTWLRLRVVTGWSGAVPAGVAVTALAPDGEIVVFETGTGIADPTSYNATHLWNDIAPHWWDDREQCLAHGARQMWIVDAGAAPEPGRRIVIETLPARVGDRPLREIVQLLDVGPPVADPILTKVARLITWDRPLEHDHDLVRTSIGANVVPATQGVRHVEQFMIGEHWIALQPIPFAMVRTGANRTAQYLHTLVGGPLAWLAQDAADRSPLPELVVSEVTDDHRRWQWLPTLLDADPSDRQVLTVEPSRYRLIDPDSGFAEYDGSSGDTIRFGDGTFGAIPAGGAVFEVAYRVGGGERGNIPADALDRIDPAHPVSAMIVSVGNPLPARGGSDQEPAYRVRELAPQAFRAKQYRAVRVEDYEQAAVEDTTWVQRAGTTFRYTGSWLTVFTAADPRDSETVTVEQTIDLTRLLDRRRMAGYESYVLPPRYAALDLRVVVCARPEAFRGDVKRGIVETLDLRHFFHPDHFSFGVALERSRLEAAIQEVHGVDGVISIEYRRRGYTAGFIAMPEMLEVARDEIVRVDNDPSRPDAGSLRVDVRGGK